VLYIAVPAKRPGNAPDADGRAKKRGKDTMIVVRNVFHLKFGRSKDALPLWKEGVALSQRLGFGGSSPRLLTDLTGDFYTLVLEMTFDSLAEYERSAKEVMGKAEWQAWYRKIPEVTESGHREIFNLISD
jgi:hypothetical protein